MFSFTVKKSTALVLILWAGAVAGWGVRLQIDSCLSEPGTLGLRAGLSADGLEAVVTVEEEGPAPPRVRAGFSSPGVAAGPLSPAGLLRQTENPLGFDAGSGVFLEPTGLVLDGSLSGAAGPGLLLALLPGRLGFFVRGAGAADALAGCYTALTAAGGVSLEALLEASDPPPRPAADGWYLGAPAFAGGGVLHLAGRVRWERPFLRGAVAAGLSGCGTSLPGCFLQSAVSLGGPRAGVDLLFAAASRDYRALDGGASLELLEAAVRLRACGPGARAVFSHAARTRAPGRPDHSRVVGSTRSRLALEKDLFSLGRIPVGLRVEGEKNAHRDAEGRLTESVSAGCAFVWGPADRESSLKAELQGGLCRLSCALCVGGPAATLSGETKMEADGETAWLTAVAGLRVWLKAGSISLQAGVRGLPAENRDALSCALFRLEWSAASEWALH